MPSSESIFDKYNMSAAERRLVTWTPLKHRRAGSGNLDAAPAAQSGEHGPDVLLFEVRLPRHTLGPCNKNPVFEEIQ